MSRKQKKNNRDYELRTQLTHLTLKPDAKMFDAIEKLRSEAPIGMLLSFMIPVLENIVKEKWTPPEEVSKWLRLAEEHFDEIKFWHQSVRQVAGVAVESKNPSLAMKFLNGVDWTKDLAEVAQLKKDRRFKSLNENKDFQKVLALAEKLEKKK